MLSSNADVRNTGVPIQIRHYQRGAHPEHAHDYLELMIVLAPNGSQRVNGRTYRFARGQVFCLGYADKHEIVVDPRRHCDFYNINFHPEAVFSSPKGGYESLGLLRPFFLPEQVPTMILSGGQLRTVISLCEIMLRRDDAPGIFHSTAMSGLLSALLSAIAESSHGKPTDDTQVLRIMHYITMNFKRALTTASIAEHFSLSPSGLSHLIKRSTDLTVKTILVRRRIIEAKKLLSSTDLKPYQVAAECGFNDASHFFHCFREDTHCTPEEFRQRVVNPPH